MIIMKSFGYQTRFWEVGGWGRGSCVKHPLEVQFEVYDRGSIRGVEPSSGRIQSLWNSGCYQEAHLNNRGNSLYLHNININERKHSFSGQQIRLWLKCVSVMKPSVSKCMLISLLTRWAFCLSHFIWIYSFCFVVCSAQVQLYMNRSENAGGHRDLCSPFYPIWNY